MGVAGKEYESYRQWCCKRARHRTNDGGDMHMRTPFPTSPPLSGQAQRIDRNRVDDD